MPKEEKKNEPKTIEEEKKDLAQTFGLSLEDIEHFKLDNGHEFFKFKDPKDQSIKVIEHIDYNTNMNDMFKNTQNNLSSAKTNDASINARNIYDYNVKNKNLEVNLVTITDIRNNEYTFKSKMREPSISTRISKQVQALIKAHEEERLNIRYISLDYGFGIDQDGVVIDVNYDFVNSKANFKTAEVVKYNDKEITVDENNYVVELTDEEVDAICDQITVTEDEPVVEEAKNIEINGEQLNTKIIAEAYKDPSIINNNSISKKQQSMYRRIIDRLAKRFNNNKTNTKAKQFVLTNNNNNNRAA